MMLCKVHILFSKACNASTGNLLSAMDLADRDGLIQYVFPEGRLPVLTQVIRLPSGIAYISHAQCTRAFLTCFDLQHLDTKLACSRPVCCSRGTAHFLEHMA